jgi:hypothetical protein
VFGMQTNARTARRPSNPSMTRRAAIGPRAAAFSDADEPDPTAELHGREMPARIRTAEAPSIAEELPTRKHARRRGRPIKSANPEPQVVEWWKPAWQRKVR